MLDIKDIINRIIKLNTKEKFHILNILKLHNIDYTKNSNGYFFNFLSIEDAVLHKMEDCLELMESNRDLIKEIDKKRNSLLMSYKQLVEEKLETSIKKRRDTYTNTLKITNYNTNITLFIKRIYKFKKPTKYGEEDTDPEVLFKESQKQRFKFDKDSVYFRLMSRIKSFGSRQENRSRRTIEKEDTFENFDETMSQISDVVDDVVDDVADDIDVSFSDGEDDDNIFTGEDDLDPDADAETNYNTKTDIEDFINIESTESDMSTSMSYYRNILNQRGYIFDDNKRCLLVHEDLL